VAKLALVFFPEVHIASDWT